MAGQYAAYVMRMRVRLLEKAEVMVSMIRNEINYVALPSNDLIEALVKIEEFKELKFIDVCLRYMTDGFTFPEAWRKSLYDKRSVVFFRKSDIEVIEAFGERFGVTDAEGQISNCELCVGRLKTNLSEAKRDFDQYSKLACGLGFLSGLGIIIVFL